MAPEILIKSCRLEVASFENLQKVDIWAFDMVLFNLVNPNVKYPFQLDLVKGTPILKQLPDILLQRKHPSESPKYSHQRETIWGPIIALKEKCTTFSPASRPTASEVSDEFRLLLAKGDNVVISKNIMSSSAEKGLVSIFYHNYFDSRFTIILQLCIHLTVSVYM